MKKVAEAFATGLAVVAGVYVGHRIGEWLIKPTRRKASSSRSATVYDSNGDVLIEGPAGEVFVQPGLGLA